MTLKALLLTFCLATAAAHADFVLCDGDTVVFLGDSITAARGYTKIVEHYTLMRFPERKVRFVNAGQGGDTAAGSLQRLERDVFQQGATVVTVAFGVNDIGWGMKADAEHKQRYLDGIRAIVEQCQARNVRPLICSAAITAEAPDTAENGFLQKMTDEGLALARSLGAGTIDLQRGMREIQRRVLETNAREPDPKKHTHLHTDDGVHLTDLGQLAMAYAMLKGLGAPEEVSSASIDAGKGVLIEAAGCAISQIRKRDGALEFIRLDDGLPLNLGTFSSLNYRWVPIPEGINRYLLAVQDLPAGEYEILAGGRLLGTASAARLAQGLNICSMTADAWQPGGPWDAQSCSVKELVDARDKLWMSSALQSRYLTHQQHEAQTKALDDDLIALQRATAKPAAYHFEVREAAAAALDRAFSALQTYDWEQSREALQPIDDAVIAAQAGSARCEELENRLATVLASSASRSAKDYVCRQLSLIGTSKSVAALAALLPNPELSHLARYALERIPDPSAAAAFEESLTRTRGQIQIGIINSLGARADPKAAGALAGLLADSEVSIACAAVTALGNIGTSEAARALEQFHSAAPSQLQPLVGNARLVAAEALARRGQRDEAARIFGRLYTGETAGPLRLAAFRGLVAAEPEHAVALLSGALAGENEPLRSLASRLIAEQPLDHALKPFLDALPSLPTSGQVALLDAVRRRGDPSARVAVLKACDSAEALVRVAALRALAVVGSADDVPRLARLAAAGSSEESAAARLALANLPGREPSIAMLALLSDALIRIELMKALAARSATEAAPALANQLTDSDESVRHAALEALVFLGDERQAPAVIAFLNRASDEPAQQAAGKTLEALVGRSRSKTLAPLVAGFKDAPPPSRVILLEQLGRLGGSEALEVTRNTLNDGDESVRDAAFRALVGWPDARALPDLLRLAQSETEPGRRTLAFRGAVRLCRESQMSAAERLACLSQPSRLAVSTEEKMLIISALAEVLDAGSLRLLGAYLEEAALVDAASLAVVKVSSALGPGHKDEAVAALERVLNACQNPETQGQSRSLLKKLGATTD